MTPDALRAAIASARLRPRMYAQTGEHLASMLYGMVAGAAPDGVDVGPAWGDAYSPANVHAPTDAEVCDAAEATVSALWPQGDAPAGDECAAFSDVLLDTPMPPAFVAALASLSPAQPDALDLGALHARLWSPTCSQCGAVDPPTEDAERWDGQRFLRHVDCPKPDDIYASEVGDHGLTRAEQRALVARVRELEAQLAAAQPAPLDFAASLAAVRNGRFVPPPTWVRYLACGGARADVDGAPCEPCRGTGRQPPPLADRDMCPKCGTLDLDHACPKSAATLAGEVFAAEHPYAAGRILG